MISVVCPSCQHGFQSPASDEDVACPKCGHRFEGLGVEDEAAEKQPVRSDTEQPRLGILVPHAAPAAPAAPTMSPSLPAPAPAAPQPPPRRLTTLVTDVVRKVMTQDAAASARGVVELTAVGLTLGMTSLAITWPWRLGIVGLLMSGAGLALSAAALYLVQSRKQGGLAVPLIALLLNIQGLAMAGYLTWNPPPSGAGDGERLLTIADLRSGLSDPDPLIRALTVGQVGDIGRNLETARQDLLAALEDSDARVRSAAAEALAQIGPAAKLAYPALVQVSKFDPSDSVREQARRSLKKITPPASTDLGDFLAAMKEEHVLLRAAAAQALGMIDPPALQAVADLERKGLTDAEPEVQVSAAQALWEITHDPDKGLAELVSGLKDKKASVRARAASALGKMRTGDARALQGLEEALRDREASVRVQAAMALGNIGDRSKSAVPSLQTALHDVSVKVRVMAAQALWVCDRLNQGVPALCAALKEPDGGIRLNAVVALGKMGPEARGAVGPLAVALKDTDADVRLRAAEALHHIGPESHPAVDALRDALIGTDPALRPVAAFALSGIGKKARAALPQLEAALGSPDQGLRLFAARALWTIEPKVEQVVPVIVQILHDAKDSRLKARAAAILGMIGPPVGARVAYLHDALHDDAALVKLAAARALEQIGGPWARITYASLFELAKEEQPDEAVRKAAASAAKKLGRPTKKDVPVLMAGLESGNARFRAASAVALWLLHREAREAVGALSKKLNDPDELVRTSAAFALAAIGPDAAEAVPALITALGHEDELLRGRAAYTLGEIGARAEAAVEPLNRVLANDKEKSATRVHAAQALWNIAQQSRGVIPVLSSGLLDKDDVDLNISAAETLAKIASRAGDDKDLAHILKADAVPALGKALREGNAAIRTALESGDLDRESARKMHEKNDQLRSAAAAGLGTIGFEARNVLPLLVNTLENEGPAVRIAVAEAIGKIAAAETQAKKKDVRAKAAYASLGFYSKVDPDERVQRAANNALGKIGAPAPDDVDVLLAVIEDPSQELTFRNGAVQVLGIIGAEAAKGVPRLGRMLRQEEDANARVLAAYALAGIGPPARSEAGALADALKNSAASLQSATAYALGEIFHNMPATPANVREALEQAAATPDENVAETARSALKKLGKAQ